MRNLNGHDVFMALRLLQKIGVKDELIELANYINNVANGKAAVTTKNQQEIGARLVFGLLANCGDESAERAFFAFLSGPLEVDADDLAQKDVLELCESVAEYIGTIDKDRWRGFFHSLLGAIKSTS